MIAWFFTRQLIETEMLLRVHKISLFADTRAPLETEYRDLGLHGRLLAGLEPWELVVQEALERRLF